MLKEKFDAILYNADEKALEYSAVNSKLYEKIRPLSSDEVMDTGNV